MDEGAPARALEQGEKVSSRPCSICRAPRTSRIPARTSIDSSPRTARRAAWWISSCSTGEGQGFIMRKAGSPASNRALELINEFVHKQIR